MYFFAGASLLAMAGTIFDTVFANYLKHAFSINAEQRGLLELPREFPGFAVTILAGALLFLPEVRVAAVAGAAAALGMVGLAFFTPSYGAMIGWMVLFSTGVHLMMPVQEAMAVNLAEAGRRGKRLGQLALVTTAAAVVACGLVWLVMHRDREDFRTTFLIAVGLSAASAAVFLVMPPHIPHNRGRPRLVFRRRYWLYYVLSLLFGARKQIFLTFAPWVIVTVFDKPATVIATLFLASRLIGTPLKPLLGRLIDRVGPRLVLVADAVLLVGVCLGYAFARRMPSPALALATIYTCFVLDDLLFAAGMARTVYVTRLATNQEEIVGTLAAGVSLNHAVSMIVPVFGGLLWLRTRSPEPVFLVAAGIMVVTLVFVLFIRAPAHGEEAAAVPSPPRL